MIINKLGFNIDSRSKLILTATNLYKENLRFSQRLALKKFVSKEKNQEENQDLDITSL